MPRYKSRREYYKSKIQNLKSEIELPPARLERATHSLEGCCSIQLSYGSVKERMKILAIDKTLVNVSGEKQKKS